MIVDLHKYLIVGPKQEVDRFFELAQKGGFMEFIGLSNKKTLEMPDEAKSILSALKLLKMHFIESSEPYQTDFSPLKLSEEILSWNEELENLLEEKRILKAEIARVAPFGKFSRQELDQLEKESRRIFQFFCMKSDLAKDTQLPSELIYVGTEYDLDYFVAIHKERVQYPKMIEIVIDRPVQELKERLKECEITASSLEKKLQDAARATEFLQNGLYQCLNAYDLKLAKHDALDVLGDNLFAIEAWVPKTKTKSLYALLNGLNVYLERIQIESDDKIPTCLQNKGASKIGEDLVQVYDTPLWTDKDPSLWVLVFFCLFFAMIVSDAGYGLIYLIIGLVLKFKCKKASGFLKRFIKLTLLTSTACIIWGILTASFFGIEIGPNNRFRKISFLHTMATTKAEYHLEKKDDVYQEYVHQFPKVATAENGHQFLLDTKQVIDGKVVYQALNNFYDNILLEISLFVGVFHLSLSFLRNLRKNWTGIGWILFMIGGYLYFPSFLDATSMVNFLGWISKPVAYAVGKQLLYIGLGLVFIISLLEKKKWGALHELTNAIQVFADVLSYLRLYALALAGMIMASTFNELGMDMGIIGGIFIILLGHITNLQLVIMSGVIHGLRLNFLEWYHYSFEGGGRLFAPLRIRKIK